MNIVSYQPWGLLSRFHDDVSRFYEDGVELGRPSGRDAVRVWSPAVDVKEGEEEYVIHADVPGTRAEDIEVTLEDGVLTIKGERKAQSSSENEGYQRLERVQGSFVRRFTLPETSNDEGIVARVTDGVLTVKIPKQEKACPRRIPVN